MYWDSETGEAPGKPQVEFTYKVDTDLYALAKAKTSAVSLAISKDGSQFAMFCADG